MKNRISTEGKVVWLELTQGFKTCIDVEDLPKIELFKWCAFVSSNGKPYAVTNRSIVGGARRGTLVYLHTLLVDSNHQVDHRNGDTLCNRRFNLRPATNQQNQFNREKLSGTSSRFKGVSWNKRLGMWQAYIRVNGVRQHLGYFKNETTAACAYDVKAKELFGEFARLNFPSS